MVGQPSGPLRGGVAEEHDPSDVAFEFVEQRVEGEVLVASAQHEDHGAVCRSQTGQGSFGRGGDGVVDELDSGDLGDQFESVGDAGEGAQHFGRDVVRHEVGDDGQGGEGVEQVVLAGNLDVADRHERAVAVADVLAVAADCAEPGD